MDYQQQQHMKNQGYPNPPPYFATPVMEQPQIYPPPPQTIYHHTQTITQPVVVSTPMGPEPQIVVCPGCRQQVQTVIRHEINSNTHRNALIICIFCCWPCALLPYFMDSCQNRNHHCPLCGTFVGTYNS